MLLLLTVLHARLPSCLQTQVMMTFSNLMCCFPTPALCRQTAGAEQAPLVQQLLQSLMVPAAEGCATCGAAFVDVAVHEDCYGVPRFVSATRVGL